MKKIIFLVSSFLILFSGCNDDAFLSETPDDFMTVENSYLNAAQFRSGLNHLYVDVRQNYNYRDNPDDYFHFGSGTDLFFRPVPLEQAFTDWTYINPSYAIYKEVYNRHYSIITKANILLKQTDNPAVRWNNETEKLEAQAEARFFRAYAYRYLGCMFGGVPILREPVTKPRYDFTRNSRQEVYELCVEDFDFAARYLPTSTTQPGRVVKAAALHYLAEMYIALGDQKGGDKAMYQKAIDASSTLLSGQVGDYKLMTERHGWRKNVSGKDAFWDLFQMKSTGGFSNFSYQTGNKESVWVIQVDKYLTGGLSTQLSTRTNQARTYWPSFWALNRFGYSTVARDWTGRGVGWLRGTDFLFYEVWSRSGAEDQRNAEFNINRIFRSPFPLKADGTDDSTKVDVVYSTDVTLLDGTKIVVQTKPGDVIKREWLTTNLDTLERVFPRIMKLGSDWHYNQDPSNGFVMESYAIRLAETYLVRAEAYMKFGDNGKAAADINTVRARAKAKPIDASKVNIDYILDERARELCGEEMRTLTLCRLGKLYDRAKAYGYPLTRKTVAEKNNLCPIPQSVIEANSQAKFPNNPEY